MSKQVEITKDEVVYDGFFPLRRITFNIKKKDGSKEEQVREVYSSANGVTVLLYNKQKQRVVLIKQFRIASYLNGNNDGKLLETCAGILEEKDPAAGIKREIEEETGYKVDNVEQVFELYSTPGSVSEKIFYFIAEYQPYEKVGEGGGLEEEQEEIDVVEMDFEEAFLKVQRGEIKDAKTVILLLYAKLHLFTGERVFDVL